MLDLSPAFDANEKDPGSDRPARWCVLRVEALESGHIGADHLLEKSGGRPPGAASATGASATI